MMEIIPGLLSNWKDTVLFILYLYYGKYGKYSLE